MPSSITKQAEDYLEALAKALEVPTSRYEQAEKSYKSLGDWLHRDQSTIVHFEPEIFVQGSFRLGTAIKPVNETEHYDIDSVLLLNALSKQAISQAGLKELVGVEIHAYRDSQNMSKPAKPGRRCWTLEYADGAQFHMDILPSIPNGAAQRLLLEDRALDTTYADSAIAITDDETGNYQVICNDWPRSNPKGYSEWFKSRMGDVFTRRRAIILDEMTAEGVTASIEDVPVYRVRTPLQSAIMILKRHRDKMFEDDPDEKPISVILSTLSARSYGGEETIAGALITILNQMGSHVGHDGEKFVITNPTDPSENFADRWENKPARATAFFSWLKQAQSDFGRAATLIEHREMSSVLADRMGRAVTDVASDTALNPSAPPVNSLLRGSGAAVAAASTPSFADAPRVPTKPAGFA